MAGLKKNRIVSQLLSRPLIGISILFFLAVLLLWTSHMGDRSALSPMMGQIRFDGSYRIGDGPWQPIEAGRHIPATKGDVTLQGNFWMYTPDGVRDGSVSASTPISLYSNHIHITIREGEHDPYTSDAENPLLGTSGCGAVWSAYTTASDGSVPIEIRIHNPHRFGNESAIDDLLGHLAFWDGIDFEQFTLEKDRTARSIGVFLLVTALVILGSALFCTLLHIRGNLTICTMGLLVLLSSIIFIYSTSSIHLLNELFTLNTIILYLAFLFYYLFLSISVIQFMDMTGRFSSMTVWILGILDGIFLLLAIITDIRFYDLWAVWVGVQMLSNLILLGCLIRNFHAVSRSQRWIYTVISLNLVAFEIDMLALAFGWWAIGMLSKVSFILLFIVMLFLFLLSMPSRINTAAKAQELELQKSLLEAEKKAMEAELKDSRISIMLSQIQPHFIYNTLGTIERMCLKDPQKAFELVRNFSLYLRGNFSELDSVAPIRFSQEINHVQHYVNIEKVRFSDMTVAYQLDTTDFLLPALSVQPLVENAIKHGLMQLETGGTVWIHSYETAEHYCVEIRDNGGGFDTSLPIDTKSHMGLRNIRGRLEAMVGGSLQVESTPGSGTTATILIPKEPAQNQITPKTCVSAE